MEMLLSPTKIRKNLLFFCHQIEGKNAKSHFLSLFLFLYDDSV